MTVTVTMTVTAHMTTAVAHEHPGLCSAGSENG